MTHHPLKCLSSLSPLVLAVFTLTASDGFAASDTWNVNANGNWSVGTNWLSGSQYPNGLGQTATFGFNITAGRIVTLTAPITLGSIIFNDTDATEQGVYGNSGYTIEQAGYSISLDTGTTGYNSGDLVQINLPATNKVGHRFINTSSGGKLILVDNVLMTTATTTPGNTKDNRVEFSIGSSGGANQGALSGTRNLTKTGPGQLIIVGDSDTYSGIIRVAQGLVQGRGTNNPANQIGKNAFGTGTIQLTNGLSTAGAFNGASLGLNNYLYHNIPFGNALVLEQVHASRGFQIEGINMNYVWTGNISSTTALNANVLFSTYGRASNTVTLSGNNSSLTLAAGRKLQTNEIIGVGASHALGTGNALPVDVFNNQLYQSGILATIATTVASPISVHNAANTAAAVLGSTIISGTATFNGAITLNANTNAGVRETFLSSETGGNVVFASLIGNGTTNGISGPLTKIGGGRVEISGNNTYLGSSSVRSGELVLSHNSALGGATSNVKLGETTTAFTAVRLATTGYQNFGTWTAGTYTGNATSIDGVSLVAGNRVLVKDSLDANRNGIYVVQTPTSTWVRATDLDDSAELSRGLQVAVSEGTLSGSKTYFQAQAGTLTLDTTSLDWHLDIVNPAVSILNNGARTISRNIDVVANNSTGKSTLGGISAHASTFSGAITLARGLTVTAASGGSVNFSGAINGSYGVTKEGSGKVIFTNAKSYTGATTVATGTLEVNGTLATSGLNVSSGATLQGSGTVTNAVVVNGTLAPGSGVGTLTVGSALFGTGSAFNIEVDGTGAGSADRLNVGGNLNITNAALGLNILTTPDDLSYVLSAYGTLTGTFASVPTLPTGYRLDYNFKGLKQIALVKISASDSWNVDAGGTWSSVNSWQSGAQYPNGVGHVATFGFNITAGRTIALDAATTLGGIVFNDTNATGQGGTSDKGYGIALGGYNLTFDTGSTGFNASDLVLIDVPATNLVGHNFSATTGKLVFTDNVRFNVANNVELSLQSVQLMGTGNLLKTGTGQLLVGGNNSGYSGNIRVEGGRLQARGNSAAFGTGSITLTNGGGSTLSFNNYGSEPTFSNNLALEKTSGVTSDFLISPINTNLVWNGNLTSNAVALNVNLRTFVENGGKAYNSVTFTGNNSGLLFAADKGFTSTDYIGVGSANAIGAGNAAQVTLLADSNHQAGLLATVATTIAAPVKVFGGGNLTAAVIGANISSGTATYTGAITLNSNLQTAIRQIFLRSEGGGTVQINSAIGNGATGGALAPLTKIGGGRVTLNGNNAYLGNSAARSGELMLGHNNALGTATSTVNLGETTPLLADVRVATTLSGYQLNLGTWTSAGGGTYTGAPSSIDGITLAVNDRILVKDRGVYNGIYYVQSAGTWVRATDQDSTAEISYGQQVKVTAGTVNSGKVFFQAQRGTSGYPGTLTLNSSPLDYHPDVANPDVSILNNGVTINRNIEVVANSSTGKSILGGVNTTGTSIFSGIVTLARGLTVTAPAGGSVNFTGAISGSYGVTKEGSGKVIFTNAKSYTGATTVAIGTLEVNGTLATSGVNVSSGATLQGSGTVTNTVVVNGTLAPGSGVGTLTTGSTSFATGTLAIEINGTTSDQLVSTGTLNLNGASLALVPVGSGYTPQSYVIAQGAPLTGTFASVPAGFTVNYTATQAILHVHTTYYVSPTGDDGRTALQTANNINAPWRTIQKAASQVEPGDTVEILQGTYRETVIVPNSGTATAPIIFQPHGSDIVTISGANPVTATWAQESSNVWYVNLPFLTREVWTNITGSSVASIPVGTTPTFTDKLSDFEAPRNWADNYGTRVSGVFTAPTSGYYTFWIASDDQSQLWLSSNSSPANKMLIATVNSYTDSRQWTKEANQKSVPQYLVQGQQYYIEALQKEGGGGDNLAVGWSRPFQSTTTPSEIMPGSVFSAAPGGVSLSLGDGNQVFQNGAMKPEARWPNDIPANASTSDTDTTDYPWQSSRLEHPAPYNQLGEWSYVDSATYTDTVDFGGTEGVLPVSTFVDTQLPATVLPDGTYRGDGYWVGARVHIMSGDGWVMNAPFVKSYTHATKTIKTDSKNVPKLNAQGVLETGAYTIKGGNEYYLTGLKGELDSPGEWFYKPAQTSPVGDGKLFFYSATAPTGVEVKTRKYGFDLSEKSFVKLVGLDFFACTIKTSPAPKSPATTPLMTTDCEFDDLTMNFLNHNRFPSGESGLILGSRCVLRNSELAFSSGNLVLLRGSDIRVINNYLHDMCYHPNFSEGISSSEAGDDANAPWRNLISHNTIHTAGRGILGYPGRSALIEYNNAYDAMRITTDGAIFYWAKDGGNGTVRYNLLHNTSGPVGHSGVGARGLYWDNQNSGWIAHHNIIWNISGYAMQNNAPTSYDMVFNNTTWNCGLNGSDAMVNSFWADGPSGMHVYNNLFNGNPAGNQSVWSQSDMRYNRYSATNPGFVDVTPANYPYPEIPDFRLLASASESINQGTPIPGVTDIAPSVSVDQPDLGALEYNGTDWTVDAGCDFVNPHDPIYQAPAVSYGNLLVDGGFERGNLSPNWSITGGGNVGLIKSNGWYDHRLHSSYYGLQFGGGPETEVSQVVSGLQSNRRYKFYCTVLNTDASATVTVGVRAHGYDDQSIPIPSRPTDQIWGGNNTPRIQSIYEVPFITGQNATSATVYIKVTRASGSEVARKNANGTFPTSAIGVADLSNFGSSTLVEPFYPATGVYVDDLAVIWSEALPISESISPKVHYLFDEPGGPTAADSSVNGISATLGGATFAASQAGHGNALTFDNLSDSASASTVTVPSTPYGSFTVAFWLKLNSIGASENPRPVNNAGWEQKGWHITSAWDFGLGMYLWDGTKDADNKPIKVARWFSTPLSPGVWRHVTYTVDRVKGEIRCYNNGVLDGTTVIPSTFGGIDFASGLRIGTGFSNGQMDDFQLWEHVLDATQITDIATPDATKILHLALDESAGSTKAWDSSVSGKTGTLVNMAPAAAWVNGAGNAMLNGALNFDGVNDYVDCGNPASLPLTGNLTISFWVKPTNVGVKRQNPIDKSYAGEFALTMETNGSLTYYHYKSSAPGYWQGGALPPGSLQNGVWQHVLISRDVATRTLKGYLNGVLQSTLVYSTDSYPVATSSSLFVGKGYAGNLIGSLDDVRIYSKVFTWIEALELSNHTNPAPYW